METVDLVRLVSGEGGAFRSGLALNSEDLAAVTWVIAPGDSTPVMAFSRGESAYIVLEGTVHIVIQDSPESTHPPRTLESGQLLSVPRSMRHHVGNDSRKAARVLLVRAPGPRQLGVEELGIGRLMCPLCAGVLPLETGDRPGDRFVCTDCACVLKLEVAGQGREAELRLVPAQVETTGL